MSIEIERKFLVLNEDWRCSTGRFQRFRQGYLSKGAQGVVRVRSSGADATLTVKGPRIGITRQEFEFPIPVEQADDMLRDLCAKPLLEKVRHWVEHRGMMWEVDVYCGGAAGLVVAEIELEHPDQTFPLPPWAGAEVTFDVRYRNRAIAQWGLPGGPSVGARDSSLTEDLGVRPHVAAVGVIAASQSRPRVRSRRIAAKSGPSLTA